MSKTPTLNARFLQSVAPPQDGKRLEYPDTKVRGLYFRVTSNGVKSWSYRYRRPDRSQGRETLGTFPHLCLEAARAKALASGLAVSNKRDPSRERQKERRDARAGRLTKPQTVAQLWEHYAKAKKTYATGRKKRPWAERTADGNEWLYRTHIAPALARVPLQDLDRATLKSVIVRIGKRGETTANHAHTLMASMFNWAVAEEYMRANPIAGLPKLYKSKSRSRVLNDEELRLLIAALEPELGFKTSRKTKLALKIALLTGARANEVIGLHAREIDAQARSWTIPATRSQKNENEQVIPLSDAAVRVLSMAFGQDQAEPKPIEDWEGFAFPTSRNVNKPMERHSLTRAMNRLITSAGIDRATPHDLRRTMATYVASERVSALPHIVSALLGHQLEGPAVTQVYNRHRYDKEKRAALEAWADLLEEIVFQQPCASNVKPVPSNS